jgi:hypothetical protein
VEGDYLAVEVSGADGIAVDKVDGAYSASGKGFNCKSAYSTYPENCHAAVLEFFHGFTAEKQFASCILFFHISPPLIYLLY